MDDSSELYLTLKYGSLDNALAKWLTQSEPFSIEKGARVGAGAIIMAGVTIGKNAFVQAGSVVFSDVNENEIVVGNPAQAIGQVTSEHRI